MIFVWDKLLFIVFQFHLIRYTQDGVLAIKTDDELEHEEVKERMEFWVGDTVLCEWDDGETYSATILASGCKLVNHT